MFTLVYQLIDGVLMLTCRFTSVASIMLLLLLMSGRHANGQTFDRFNTAQQYEKYTVNFKPLHPSTYYLCQWKSSLPQGIVVVRRLADNVAIVKITDPEITGTPAELSIYPVNNTWKFSPALERLEKRATNPVQKYIVSGSNLSSLKAAIVKLKPALRIVHADISSNSLVVECSAKCLYEQLAPLQEIIFIDIVTTAHSETNIIGYNRSFHGINAVDYLLPGANGTGIVTGIKEQKMEEADLDLWKRVVPSTIAAATTSNHATVIASIIGGAGNSYYDGRGIAWGCSFYSSSFSNLFADDSAVLNANRVSVQNHSYGTVNQQFYGAEAVSYDALTWNNRTFIPVMSAGNQGELAASDGPYANLPGFANLTGNFKMAKNAISVGAMDNNEIIALQSSAGPLYDGRIAPQLTALGPNGTSDAAAVVTGTIAVLQQVYADSNTRVLPEASLVKAVLYSTAGDIGKTGIDYKTGYGLLDSYAAVKCIQQKHYDTGSVANGQVWMRNLAVPAGAAQLRVTLSWTDTTAIVNTNRAIINDLDLEVHDQNNVVYQPWVLSSIARADMLSAAPTRMRDSLNTAEQVSISLPVAGNYHLVVKGTAVKTGPLRFSIAYNIDTLNTFVFASPQHAADVDLNESATAIIRWKTFVADTNATGNLYVRFGEGNQWQLLQPGIKLYRNKYSWVLADTTAVAMLKMETGYGIFYSRNFVLGHTLKLNVDFNCADSVQLSWKKQPYANAYRLYALTDSAYLKIVQTVTDTFVVIKRAGNPSRVFAVQPVLNNGVEAARSIAVNVDLQGVQCFYKTLNYELLDNNQLNLILGLSTTAYVDSVYFEQVNAGGGLLQTYGNAVVKTGEAVYRQQVNGLAAGTTYVRAKLKLKNGVVIYTDALSVLTSGPSAIVFYPHPAPRKVALNYMLKQGISPDSRLELFSSDGRLIRSYTPLPGKLQPGTLPAGVIIFKLFDRANNLLQTGKLIVQ